MSLYIDLTEFLSDPHRTGIQRVTGELCRHWPTPLELTPVKVRQDGRLTILPANTLDVISEYFRTDPQSHSDALARIHAIHEQGEFKPIIIELSERDVILCPEVFFDPVRVNFYSNLPAAVRAKCCFIVYDLLPLTHPEHFNAGTPHQIIGQYFCLLRSIGHLAFISRASQQAFYNRFMRNPHLSGRVIRLGSDGLGKRNTATLGKAGRSFVVVGTVEPRKNHGLILTAFEPILQKVKDIELVFLGRIGWIQPSIREQIEHCRALCPGFRHITDADDTMVHAFVCNARATIFVSAVEGFGLPPVESLWLGTPTIVSPSMPSLEEYGSRGVHIVQPLTAANLREAAVAFLDDDYHRMKREECRNLNLPDWRSFASEVQGWIREVQSA